MTFPSWQYLILFLPAACVVHEVLARRDARLSVLFLIAASFVFYGMVAGHSVLVLAASVLGNGLVGRLLLRRDASMAVRRLILGGGVVANIVLILWIRGFEPVLGAHGGGYQAGLAGLTFVSIGVSFYSLQQIAFLFDCHRGVIRDFRPTTFTLASVFFPHLLAGPIVRYREMVGQIEAPREKRTPPDNVAMGLTLITVGIAKHMMLAQPLREYMSPVLDNTSGLYIPVFPEAGVILLALTLFIYFDFSAYSDMACGAACLLGYRMPVNFLSPLEAFNPAEFWRRWHITLSRFMRDYVFLPINAMTVRFLKRRGIVREEVPVVAATMTTFLAMGLWHGTGETFIAWGLATGMLVSMAQVVGLRRTRGGEGTSGKGLIGKMATGIGVGLFMLATTSLFMSPTLEQAVQLMRGLVGLNGVSLSGALSVPLGPLVSQEWLGTWIVFEGWFPGSGINNGFSNLPFLMVLLGGTLIGYVVPSIYRWMAPHRPILEKVPALGGFWARLRWKPRPAWGIVMGALAMMALGLLANADAGGFLYFRF